MYVLGFFSEEEEKKYERQFKKFAHKMGVSGAQVDMLLMKRRSKPGRYFWRRPDGRLP